MCSATAHRATVTWTTFRSTGQSGGSASYCKRVASGGQPASETDIADMALYGAEIDPKPVDHDLGVIVPTPMS